MFRYTPVNLVGTDLFYRHPDLYESAIELLEEDEVKNFLQKDDFVFMMHQGYMFWYFKADGTPDPDIYFYYEITRLVENRGPFSVFVKEYLD